MAWNRRTSRFIDKLEKYSNWIYVIALLLSIGGLVLVWKNYSPIISFIGIFLMIVWGVTYGSIRKCEVCKEKMELISGGCHQTWECKKCNRFYYEDNCRP